MASGQLDVMLPSFRALFGLGASASLGQVVDVFWTQNDTSGGSSDTGTKVLAARPTRAPSTSAAIAMTPVGK